MSENDTPKLVLTPEEARRRLGISRGLMYESLRRGDIYSVRLGTKYLIPVASLEKMLADRRDPQARLEQERRASPGLGEEGLR